MAGAVQCEVFDNAGHQVGSLAPEACLGRLTVMGVFDPGCCVCKRFAMPRLQELWARHLDNPQCAVVAVGRGCGAQDFQRFRAECAAAASDGDRHIVALSLPMATDEDSTVFRSLAEAIVPRFYLLGPDASILYQVAGFEEEPFRTLEMCLEQELMYL